MLKSLSRDPRTFSEMTILKGVLYDHQKVFFREKKLHKHLAEGKNDLNIKSVIILFCSGATSAAIVGRRCPV